MVKNKDLADTVLKVMASYLIENDPSFKLMCDGELEFGKGIIDGLGEANVDEQYKFRFHFSRLIGYGYDFKEKTPEGGSSQEVFERAVSNTRDRILGDMGENLLEDKVVDERYGIYITSL